jgi:hypothetical protein
VNESRQDDLEGSAILGNLVGSRRGDAGIGGSELRLRDGKYTRGSEAPLSGVSKTGELCLRDSVPVEFTRVSLEARMLVQFPS